LAVDERSGYFFDPSKDVAMATNFVGRIDHYSIPHHLVIRMTFARAAPPAYDKKGSCYAQANKLRDSIDAGEPIK